MNDDGILQDAEQVHLILLQARAAPEWLLVEGDNPLEVVGAAPAQHIIGITTNLNNIYPVVVRKVTRFGGGPININAVGNANGTVTVTVPAGLVVPPVQSYFIFVEVKNNPLTVRPVALIVRLV